jgi:preprotein translocase subunit YajC
MDQYSTLILIALMVIAFYFLIMRPQRRRQQALAKTLSELTPGTRVMLGSGLFGTVVGVGPKQVVLEISPGNELTVLKQAVARIVTEDDEDVEADDLADLEPDEVVESEEPTAAVDPDQEPPAAGPGSKPTTAG